VSVGFTPSGGTVTPGVAIEIEWTYSGVAIYADGYVTTVYGTEHIFHYEVPDGLTVYGGFIVTMDHSDPVMTLTVARPGGWNKQDGTLTVRMDTEDSGTGVDSDAANYTVDPILAPPKMDYTEEGLDRLLDQFDGSVNLRLLAASYLQQAQDLEDAAWPILAERGLANMTGDRLDGLGDNIGLKRSGRDDDDYRIAITAELMVLRSNGTADELIAILTVLFLIHPTSIDIEFLELFPKTVYFRLVNLPMIFLPAGTADRVADTLRRAVSAATELLYVFSMRVDNETFTLSSQGAVTESSSAMGLADVSQTTGGHLAQSA